MQNQVSTDEDEQQHGTQLNQARSTDRSSPRSYSTVAGYTGGTYADPARALTWRDQIKIFEAWKASGSAHNVTCYVCRQSGEMLVCTTCCRSYHSSCLEHLPGPEEAFHCPACKSRGWDLEPPSVFNLPTARPPAAAPAPSHRSSGTEDLAHLRKQALAHVTELADILYGSSSRDGRDNDSLPLIDRLLQERQDTAARESGAQQLPHRPRQVSSTQNQVQALQEAVKRLEDENGRLQEELKLKNALLMNSTQMNNAVDGFAEHLDRLRELLSAPPKNQGPGG